jgi:hypothetical protein
MRFIYNIPFSHMVILHFLNGEEGEIHMNHETFAGWLVGIVAALTVLAPLTIFVRLKAAGSAWSIADALSEDVEIATNEKDGSGLPLKNNEGNIAKATVMKASSSRLIALLGLVSIMMLYIGVGLTLLYGFALNNTIPANIGQITNFFLYGMVMFAPYLVNKFASIFEWMK